MTELYTHFAPSDFAQITRLQEGLLASVAV
jgi:hypothetical protein